MVIEKFVKAIEKEVKKWIGDDSICIVAVEPDGVFYAEGLYKYLRKTYEKGRVSYLSIDKDGNGLWQESIKGRKVLLVDNDIITGDTYGRVMNIFRSVKTSLQIRDIKFASLEDRTGGLADFVSGFNSDISYQICKHCKRVFPCHCDSMAVFVIEQNFCLRCYHVAEEIVRRFRRIFREAAKEELTLDEITTRFNNLPGNTRVTPRKIKEYLSWGIGKEVEPGIYRLLISCKRYR